ncbi:MAG TPA: ABC transporter substrate-binding protein [Thermomicrobiales bacterium]|nr:ABC transporter substrate-binding protein [Thermomicrobiales bacterium]
MTARRFTRRTILGGTGAALAASTATGRSIFAHSEEHAAHDAPAFHKFHGQAANIPTPREQTLVFTATPTQVFDSFNPYIPNGQAEHYGLAQVCREYLFYFNLETGETRNGLGEGWEYNQDFTEVTLRLNPRAAWSDGVPVTSEDIVFSINLLAENTNLFGAGQVRDNVASVEAIDEHTVLFSLSRPNPRYHYNFVAGIVVAGFLPQPKHIWENQDPTSFPNNPPIYSGPYTLEEANADQLMYIWRKNPDYWDRENLDPKPEFIIWRQEQPVDLEVQEFQRGNVDGTAPITIDYLNQQVLAESYDKTLLFNFSDPCPRSLFPNFDGPSGLMASPEGRWAISYLIDRQVAAEVLSQPPSEPAKFPWAAYGSNEKWSNPEIQQQYDFTFDLDRAAEMLDAAGATLVDGQRQLNGEPLTVSIITPVVVTDPGYQIADMVVRNAAEVGLQMELTSLTGGTHGDANDFGDFDINAQWMCGLVFDPVQMYSQFLMRDYVPVGERALDNRNRVQLPEFDEVVTELESLDPNDEANMPMFDRALELYFQGLPVIPSAQTMFSFPFSTAYWTGWPTEDNRYAIAASWWSQFRFVIGALEPAGSE